MERNTVIHGDCREIMKDIPSCSVSAIITDPPYNYEFVGKEWNHAEIQRRLEKANDVTSSTLVKNIPYGSGLAGGVRNARWYERNRENITSYSEWIVEWGREAFRVAKPGAYIAVFNSTRTAAHVQVGLEEVGFYARDILVYRRHSGIPKGLNAAAKLREQGRDNADNWEGWHSALRNEWEAIVLLQKPLERGYLETLEKFGVGLMNTDNEGGGFQSNILEGFSNRLVTEPGVHCTPKPLELMVKLVKLLVPLNKENLVLDPFAGSGTTLVAAKSLGVSYLGIEIVEEYIPIIHSRLIRNHGSMEKLAF